MKIFVLEDDPYRIIAFHERFKGHLVQYTQTSGRAYEFDRESKGDYDFLCLDHDLGGRQMDEHEDDGVEFIRNVMREGGNFKGLIVVLHSHNSEGAKEMRDLLVDLGATPVIAPYGTDAFHTVIEALLRVDRTLAQS